MLLCKPRGSIGKDALRMLLCKAHLLSEALPRVSMDKDALQVLLCKAELLSEAPSVIAEGFHWQRCIVNAVVQSTFA